MSGRLRLLQWAVLIGAGVSLGYAAGTAVLLGWWLRKKGRRTADGSDNGTANRSGKEKRQPVFRVLKPATGWDAALIRRLAGWCDAFKEIGSVAVLTDAVPEHCRTGAEGMLKGALQVLGVVEDADRNPKLARIVAHHPSAQPGEWWVVADQEVVMDGQLRAALERLAADAAAVWSFPYRFDGEGWAFECDRAAFHLAQWPGLALLRATGRVRLCLGAVMLIPAEVMQRLGGFTAFEQMLAEDYQIGCRAAALGVPVGLAPQVVVLEADPMGWRDWWRHQRRMHATFAVNAPGGYAASLLTMSGFWWWAGCLCGLRREWLAGLLLLRLGCVRWSAACLGERHPWRLTLAALPALLMEPFFWLTTLLSGRRVWWRGAWRRLDRSGRLDRDMSESITGEERW